MKFKEYVANCNQLLLDNPDIGEYETLYSADDEGNYYNIVNYQPSIVYIDEDGEYFDPDVWDEYDITEPNSVIIN